MRLKLRSGTLALLLAGCGSGAFPDPAEESEAGVPAPSGTGFDSSNPEPATPPFTIEVSQVNAVNTTAGAARNADQSAAPVQTRATGTEHSECEPAYGRKSDSSARAGVNNIVVEAGAARFGMTATAAAQGGHYRTYIFGCIVNKGRDSTGTAEARTEAVLRIRFKPDALSRLYDLRLLASARGTPPTFTLQEAGSPARAIEATGNAITVQGGPAKVIFVRAALDARATQSGGSGQSNENAASLVDLRLEPAPLAYADAQTPFIINGQEVGPKQYPEVVAIGLTAARGRERKLHCSGTLITPTTILTAAHCIRTYGARITRGEMIATVGKFFSRPDEGPIQIAGYAYPSSRIGRPSFDPVSLRDDIGLLYLARPFSTVKNFAARHAGTPPWSNLQENQASLTLVGFGLQRTPDGELTDDGVKRYVTIPFDRVGDTTVTYDFASAGGGACRGDSGGASYLTQARRLAAVTSSGKRDCQGTGVQTRVDAYQAWLDTRIR